MPAPKHTIRTFALVCVGVTSVFLMSMIIWYTMLLAGRDWCARAIGAAQQSDRPETAISSCYTLLTQQVEALAWNSHIFVAIIALCLLVLMVIVVAGGRLSFTGSKDGISADIGSDKAAKAAHEVADAAVDKADEIEGEVG